MGNTNNLVVNQFQVSKHLIYLNHAAVAPWPKCTADAVKSFADECLHEGAKHYPRWAETEQALRAQLAQFIHAPSPDDIALVKNTSEALSMVAHGFPWQAGDNVVISDQEFPSNRIAWESLVPQGVSVTQVSLESADPEQVLIDACDAKTRLISISSVEYASGFRVDLKRLGALCKQKNIALCVDAIQGLGVFDHDVQNMNIDFLMADAHKWLLAPEGIAVFYCSEKWRDQLQLHEFGWHMMQDHYDFNQRDWQPAQSARRFECGSPNMLGIYALKASLSLIQDVGIDNIERQVLQNSELLFRLIRESKNLVLLSSMEKGRYAGIVVIKHKQLDTETLHQYLMKNNVICAMRGGGIRFSPHFYIGEHALRTAVELADNL
ncbi:MAG: aminotransferase class V-fold PLP-dependent enzyme [Gammaproteobacteria bacterium]|nr:aminotransferase class V-fold PLP-dependent enzyme [Gammaproteobacteria bacterium]